MKALWLSRVLPILLPVCAVGQQDLPTPATTLVSNSPNLQLPGSLTLTSTVTPPVRTGGMPTGNVQFYYDGTQSLGTSPLSFVAKSESFPAVPGARGAISVSTFDLFTLNYTGSTKFPKYALLGSLGHWPNGEVDFPQITVYLGSGSNLFDPKKAVSYNIPADTLPPYSVDGFAVADFNHDGLPDVLLHGPTFDTASYAAFYVVPGAGAGLFDTTKYIRTPDTTPCNCNNLPYKMAVDDFDEDGYLDFAFEWSGGMGVGLNSGAARPGKFSSLSAFSTITGFSPTAITTGHLTGSGHADIIVAGNFNSDIRLKGQGPGALAIFLGTGKGTFAKPAAVSLAQQPVGVATSDFRKSGNTDIVIATVSLATDAAATGEVQVLFGDGKGGLTSSSTVALSSAPQSIFVADFDGDGYPDILATAYDGSLLLLLNDGAGHFAKATAITQVSGLSRAVVGDLNGDGLTDIATVSTADADTYPAYAFFNSASAQAQLVTASQTLPSGTHTLTATYSGDSDFATSTSDGVPVTVTQTIPSLTWPPPASIEYGVPLGAAQLDATSNVAGAFNYSPAPGTVLPPGPSKLSALFVPADTFDYAGATAAQTITVASPALTAVAPNTASLGVATNLTVQGQGLLNGAVVKWNGTPLATTWVSVGQLTAAVPASLVNTPGTATITVVDPNDVVVSGSASVTVSSAALTGISPASGNLGSAFTLTVNGQGLLNGAVVKWNGTALTTTWVSLTQLTAAVPASLLTTPGNVTITVVDPNNVSVAGTQTFKISTPTLTAVAPNTASLGVATNLTVQGQGLLNGAVVKWNGTPLATTWVSVGQLTAAVPASLVNTPGAATITVVDPNDVVVSGSASVTVSSAALTGISPASGNLGSAFTLTVNGQGLLNGAVVKWNGTALTTTWVSLTQLTAAVPASLLTTPGNVTITVVDPNNVSVAGTQTFKISTPTLTGVSPNTASLGVATNLTVQGQGLLNGAVVKWNGTPLATTWVSVGQLTAAVPASLVNTPGTATITVVDPNDVVVSGSASVTVSSAALTGISPASGNLGSAFTLTVNGQGLLNGAVVKWNGTALTTTWVSLTQLTAAVPASLLTTPGNVTITVVDPNNVSVAGTQTFKISTPTLTNIAPTSAALGASDTTITVTGQGLLNGAVVNWNNTPLATTWVSLTQLTAVIPASLLTTTGTATITVLDPNRVIVNGKQTFTVSGIRSLTGISPMSAGLGAPITLTVTGQGLLNGAVVQWNASPLATSWVSLTQLTATVPATLLTAPGTATVTVVDPNNVSVSGMQTFTISPPTLAGISPTSVNAGSSDTTLTITGQGLLNGAVVKWNGSPLATTWVSLTKLTAVIPAALLAAAGTDTVSVVDPKNVSVSGTEAFNILAGTAKVKATVPNTVDAGQTMSPTIQLTVDPYPVMITATLTLAFTPASSSEPTDTTLLFKNNKPQYAFQIPANSSSPIAPISFMPGSTAGTITLTIRLSANGTDVTPANLVPIPITVPAGPPVILTATLSRDGDAMTVALTGLSTTRDMTQADFHFTPATGETLGTTDLTVKLDSTFVTYYQSSASDSGGTTFKYEQPFTLNHDSSKVGSVTVTLSNSQGSSQPATVQ